LYLAKLRFFIELVVAKQKTKLKHFDF
jgi:hypothetical protein